MSSSALPLSVSPPISFIFFIFFVDIGYRLLVGWTFLLDTFHTSALTYMLWVYVVDNFSNPSFLETILWPFSATPIVTTLYASFFCSPFVTIASKEFFFFFFFLKTSIGLGFPFKYTFLGASNNFQNPDEFFFASYFWLPLRHLLVSPAPSWLIKYTSEFFFFLEKAMMCILTFFRTSITFYDKLVPFDDAWQILAVTADGSIT